MRKEQRIRRVAILCIHFARNLAFYRAGMKDGVLIKSNSFWRVTNFNFYDQAILEWCKLLADKKGKHHWGKIINNKNAFESGLLEVTSMNCDELETYTDELRNSRDKFIAHLDSNLVDYRPFMDIAYKSVEYYYRYIRGKECETNCLEEFPSTLNVLYDDCYKLAEKEYQT